MAVADDYRRQADHQRALARATSLLNRRLMFERSAEHWEEMAAAADDTAQRSRVNAQAKAERADF
jgi:hypothetical protein